MSFNPYLEEERKKQLGIAGTLQQWKEGGGFSNVKLPGEGTYFKGSEIPSPPIPEHISEPAKTGLFKTKAFKGSLQDNWRKPEYWLGTDTKTIKKAWSDKGGMDGLMANPGFLLGLTMMQNAAQGKRLNESLLNDVATASGLASQYKDKIKGKGKVIEATEKQINDVKDFLEDERIYGPGWLHKMLPGKQTAEWEESVENLTNTLQEAINKLKTEAEKTGKSIRIDTPLKKKILKEIIESGDVRRVPTVRVLFDTFQSMKIDTLQLPKKAGGGPVQANTAYLVGERGPEVFTPKQSGNIVTNDDAMVTSMLLKANPDLQNLSAKRAERILKVQFPEYYDKN